MTRPIAYAGIFALIGLPLVTELPLWVSAVTALFTLWAGACDPYPALKPNKWLLRAFTLMAPVLVYLQFKTLLGPEAATSLLFILVALKIFEVHSYRDSMIFIVLILLVSMYYLVFRQDLISTAYMAASFVACVYLLTKLQRPAEAPKENLGWKMLFSFEVLVGIPLMVCLFVFFPRFSSPFGRFVEDPNAQTGFSDHLRPGDLAKLALSDTIAMRLEFPNNFEPRPEDLYFRGQVLSQTDGFNWEKATRVRSLDLAEASVLLSSEVRTPVPYQLVIEPEVGKSIITLETTPPNFEISGAATPFTLHHNETFVFRATPKKKYSLRGVAYLGDNRPQFAEPRQLEENLQLPDNLLALQPQVRALTTNISSQTNSPAQKLQMLLQYFRQNGFTYTLETPEYPNLESFLFGNKVGFCEHFASAFAILARSMDIPARVIVGFQGAEANVFGGYYIVRNRHAHAWVEAYLDNKWIRFDPTAVINSSRITSGMVLGGVSGNDANRSTLQKIWQDLFWVADSLNNRFALMLINFDSAYQLDWLQSLGFQTINKKKLWLILLGACFFIIACIFLYYRLRKNRVAPILRLREKLYLRLRQEGLNIKPSDAPMEIRERLKEHSNSADLIALYDEYILLRYASSDATEVQIRTVLAKLQSV